MDHALEKEESGPPAHGDDSRAEREGEGRERGEGEGEKKRELQGRF